MGEGDHRRLEVNWAQTIAAPLAAVTSAVLLSTVGVAGTIVGAALGSLAYTLGTAIYTHYIGTTKDRVATAQKAAAAKIGRAQSRVREASESLESDAGGADQELALAGKDLYLAQSALQVVDEEVKPVGWRTLLAGLPWKRIAIAASGVFLVAMLVIVSFELLTGRAVSSYTGGSDSTRRTSIPGLVIGRAADDLPAPGESPSDGQTPTADETDGGSTGSTASAQPSRAPAPAGETTVPQDAAREPSPTTTTANPTPTPTPTPLATEPTPESSPTP